MAQKLSPIEKTAAESDYEKKFNRVGVKDELDYVKGREASPDTSWKTKTTEKNDETKNGNNKTKKPKFRFAGRHAGMLNSGSAFVFIVAVLAAGIGYTVFFAPNIILINIKEMYTNDLADSTVALNDYYWKMMNYKIGNSQCSDTKSIKCKLSTMSRGMKQAFEKHGFTVLGSKVSQDDRDNGTNGDVTSIPESRYEVTAIIPPVYTAPAPLVSGDLLNAFSKISTADKALVYGVFNPISSFFMDTQFRQRIRTKYDLTKSVTVSGTNTQQVDQSFDNSMTGNNEGMSLGGLPNTNGGLGLGSLGSPSVVAPIEAAANTLAAESTSYVGLQCAWYSLGKAITNDAKSAKAHTLARYAMQYLKAADEIKLGTSDAVTISALSSNLSQTASGGYNGPNATDSSMYKSIIYGTLPIPSPFGLLYSLDTFDLIGALAPAWLMITASAGAEGTASNVQGQLSMPPLNLTGGDRNYCLGGESTPNHSDIKKDPDTACYPQIEASAPPGFEGTLEGALAIAHTTCPPPHYDQKEFRERGQFLMQPSLKATSATLTPFVAGLFSASAIAWANATSLLFSSQTKGVPASDAIFAGTGEILGDMAMSRGMMPSNAISMSLYTAQKPAIEKNYNEVARYNARKSPFDIYNKYSFLGSMVHRLSPTFDNKTPLFSSIANTLSILKSSLGQLNPTANAIYYLQPDIFNPIRLNCPDPEYLAINIMADTACNVRYSMGPQELAAQPGNVIDYMEKSHPDLTQKNIDELTERVAQADPELDQANVQRMLDAATAAASQPEIDSETGKAIPGSEYQKFLNYCVNRQDPWGRSGIAITYTDLPAQIQQKIRENQSNDGIPVNQLGSGSPYQQIPGIPYPSITEGASQDQDWYSGKKCTENSEELTNFRAYTMMCSVDGSLSGGINCTDTDNVYLSAAGNDFFSNNNILYLSWY